GASGEVLFARLDNAIRNIRALGYEVIETASVRNSVKCVSADSKTRADEFMSLYENPDVAVLMCLFCTTQTLDISLRKCRSLMAL
ncbi:MAG: LD-carboxypeptidase, partial [Peptococcaceae bacterium]|nr:LD-carboxypeptidase [Peptococcaceae bacterium]